MNYEQKEGSAYTQSFETKNRCFRAPEDQSEMEQQGRREEARHDLRPIDFQSNASNFPLSGRPADEETRQKNKVHRHERIPPPSEDEKSMTRTAGRRRGDSFRGERLLRGAVTSGVSTLRRARKLVAHLRPEPGAIQAPRNFRSSCDMSAVDAEQNVVRVNSGAVRRIR